VSGFDVKQSQFRKVHGNIQSDQGAPRTVEAIVKVNQEGYVPSGVKLRAWIDGTMLTGEASSDILSALENDPKVESVAVSRRLRVID
jgi:hypothetical protein